MDPSRICQTDLRRIDVGACPDFIDGEVRVAPAHVRWRILRNVDVTLLVLVHSHGAVLRHIGLEDLMHLQGSFRDLRDRLAGERHISRLVHALENLLRFYVQVSVERTLHR